MAKDNSDLGNIALSKVAEIGIASQLHDAENIDVDIRTDPGKLIQGKVDSMTISGQGLTTKQDLRMETVEVSIDRVSINPLSAIFGNIELTQPTDAQAQIILTETDINRALSSDYVLQKLQGLKMDIDGSQEIVDAKQITLDLPGDGKFIISSTFSIRGNNELKKMSATAIPHIDEDGNRISLEILAAEGQGLTLVLVMAIFEQLAALLDLRNFNIPGMSLQLRQLAAQAGRLVIDTTTQIEQLPAM
jgi:LmeA-like phospholipid-binding